MKNHLIISILILFVGVGQSNKEYNINDRVEKEIGYPKTLVTQARLHPKCRARLALVKLCLLTKRRNRSFLSSAVSIFCFFFDLKMEKYSSSNIRFLPWL